MIGENESYWDTSEVPDYRSTILQYRLYSLRSATYFLSQLTSLVIDYQVIRLFVAWLQTSPLTELIFWLFLWLNVYTNNEPMAYLYHSDLYGWKEMLAYSLAIIKVISVVSFRYFIKFANSYVPLHHQVSEYIQPPHHQWVSEVRVQRIHTDYNFRALQ